MTRSSDPLERPRLRRCGVCGSLSTRFYYYDEEPLEDLGPATLCRSRLICGLCVDAVLLAVGLRRHH